MSILSWFKGVAQGATDTDLSLQQPLVFAPDEEEFQGLNMKEALDAHTQWTQRLEAKINGNSNENLHVPTVACDTHCTLGKWIHGVAKQRFGKLAAFEELRQVHAEFHVTAGEVLEHVVKGDGDKARTELKRVRQNSGTVQLALVRLYAEVH